MAKVRVVNGQDGKAGALPEKARRVLRAAAVEAYGRAGAYVTRGPVMRGANIPDEEEFWELARYLEDGGWVADADDDYGIFVLTQVGIDEATSRERGRS